MNERAAASVVERAITDRPTWDNLTTCTWGAVRNGRMCVNKAVVLYEYGPSLGTRNYSDDGRSSPDRSEYHYFCCEKCWREDLSTFKWHRREALFTRLSDGKQFWPGTRAFHKFKDEL
jgi:hypothetical protein